MATDRMAMFSALILLALLNHGSGQEDIDTIFGLVRNLATLGNTELNYISDFASPAQDFFIGPPPNIGGARDLWRARTMHKGANPPEDHALWFWVKNLNLSCT